MYIQKIVTFRESGNSLNYYSNFSVSLKIFHNIWEFNLCSHFHRKEARGGHKIIEGPVLYGKQGENQPSLGIHVECVMSDGRLSRCYGIQGAQIHVKGKKFLLFSSHVYNKGKQSFQIIFMMKNFGCNYSNVQFYHIFFPSTHLFIYLLWFSSHQVQRLAMWESKCLNCHATCWLWHSFWRGSITKIIWKLQNRSRTKMVKWSQVVKSPRS